MNKKPIYIAFILSAVINISSCALVQKPIDKRTGFSESLKQTENLIISEDWEKAKSFLQQSEAKWKKIKPMLQIDVDHDYINVIEEDFVELGAYIDTEEKPHSLARIRTIQDIWDTIGSL